MSAEGNFVHTPSDFLQNQNESRSQLQNKNDVIGICAVIGRHKDCVNDAKEYGTQIKAALEQADKRDYKFGNNPIWGVDVNTNKGLNELDKAAERSGQVGASHEFAFGPTNPCANPGKLGFTMGSYESEGKNREVNMWKLKDA